MIYLKRVLQFGAALAVLAASHTFGFDVEYISDPDYAGFKDSECRFDCRLYGMLGGRIVILSRDENGFSSLRLVPENALEEAIRAQRSHNGELSEKAAHITIEEWDEEFLTQLDTADCVQECVVSVRFGNNHAHVYRDRASEPKLAWVVEYEETILIPSTVSMHDVLDSQPGVILNSGSDNCGGNGPDISDPSAIDHSKTRVEQISCDCFVMYDDETKLSKAVAKRTLKTTFFNCSGVPVMTTVETSMLTLLNASECPVLCDNYL